MPQHTLSETLPYILQLRFLTVPSGLASVFFPFFDAINLNFQLAGLGPGRYIFRSVYIQAFVNFVHDSNKENMILFELPLPRSPKPLEEELSRIFIYLFRTCLMSA